MGQRREKNRRWNSYSMFFSRSLLCVRAETMELSLIWVICSARTLSMSDEKLVKMCSACSFQFMLFLDSLTSSSSNVFSCDCSRRCEVQHDNDDGGDFCNFSLPMMTKISFFLFFHWNWENHHHLHSVCFFLLFGGSSKASSKILCDWETYLVEKWQQSARWVERKNMATHTKAKRKRRRQTASGKTRENLFRTISSSFHSEGCHPQANGYDSSWVEVCSLSTNEVKLSRLSIDVCMCVSARVVGL